MGLLGSPAGISKLSGQAKAATYPQPEGTLGEAMLAYGRKLGEESVFGMKIVCVDVLFPRLVIDDFIVHAVYSVGARRVWRDHEAAGGREIFAGRQREAKLFGAAAPPAEQRLEGSAGQCPSLVKTTSDREII